MSYSEVKTPQAKFRILHRFEGKPVLAADLPARLDAVLVEMVHTQPIKDPDQRAEAYISGLVSIKDFEGVLKRVKKQGVKVFFGDLAESRAISSQRDLNLMLLEGFSGILTIWLAIKLFFCKKQVLNSEAAKYPQDRGVATERRQGQLREGLISRRRRFWGLAFIFFGLWLVSSVIEVFGYFLVKVAGNTVKKGFLKAVREAIGTASNLHPEKTIVFLRNLILSEKACEIANSGKGQTLKPIILLDLHFGHAGIARMLKWPSDFRVALLRFYKPFAREIFTDPVQRDYFARLISVSWQKDHWQVERNYLVDSLEEI